MDRFTRGWNRWNPLRPLTRFYQEVLAKHRQHEDEATTSGVTDGAASELNKRVIFIHGPQPHKFINNRISTAKYNFASFVPLFLFEQFRRYSNCFFLLIALLQQIPDVSPTGRWTTLTPLIFILTVSALKEMLEDYKRHRADDETNRRKVDVLRCGVWVAIRWQKLQVGDICRVYNDQFFPADIVLISSSEPQGISFIETANLDGETNLKIRQAHPATAHLAPVRELDSLQATLQCDTPNRHLYEFNGTFKETNKRSISLGLDQMLLRGAKLRNTTWIQGVVVYTGHETKLMMNSTKAPLKRSMIDKETNKHIILLFGILLTLSLISATCYQLWYSWYSHLHWYIGLDELGRSNVAYNFLTFLILYNNLIPISLQVTAEIVRYFQARLIALDVEMYHADTDTPAQARTSNLNEELGMVKYIFSDKTGTLTCNVMEFKKCSIAGTIFQVPASNIKSTPIHEYLLKRGHDESPVIREFLTMLAVCHTVIPEKKEGVTSYHAASPDERALVVGAAQFGFVFTNRTPETVEITAMGERQLYTILNVIEFTSARKRMSIIVRDPNGAIKVYCKGADSTLYPRLASGAGSRYAGVTLAHLEQFATEGLRTLVYGVGDISENAYMSWSETYYKASLALDNREQRLEEAAELIETDLRLLGATAIEDKLQDGVPETIASLLKANIRIWVLTGDKKETAINIAHSARLIEPHMPIIILSEQSLDATREALARHLAAVRAAGAGAEAGAGAGAGAGGVQGGGGAGGAALVVEGATLTFLSGCTLRADFLALCLACRVLVCCRVSPLQKAEVVDMVTAATGAVTLAVGDGANDVAMIQRASIGVGISGVEGLQAVCASDYSIAQFRFLLRLLLVHGAWNYSRISKLILYSFYKNICLYVIELWFAIYSAWSGQILFERWSIGFYNVIFTALPPFAMGIFDKICSPEIMLRYPSLYIPSQQGLLFNVRVFWVWALNALLHAALAFWLGALQGGPGGASVPPAHDGGYLYLGNCVYTYVLVIVCLKSGLATLSWTWVTHVSIWGSVLLWLLFLLIYSYMYPIIMIGSVMAGMARMLFTNPAFWIATVIIPIATLLPDFVTTVVHNTVFKSTTEAVRENEIRKRDPDDLLDESHRNSRRRWGRGRSSPVGLKWRRHNVAPSGPPATPIDTQNGGLPQNGRHSSVTNSPAISFRSARRARDAHVV